MKKIFISLLFSAGLLLTSSVPVVSLKNIDGKEVTTADFIAKDSTATVVMFWATWCHPCLKELEAVNELIPEWKEKYKFNIVAVSVDDARTTNRVPAFVKGKAWDFEVLLDANSDFKRAMNVPNVPTTLVFDEKGEVIYTHTSYAPGDEEELEKILQKYSK